MVFSAVAGATQRDSAAISVTGMQDNAVTELRAITRYAEGQPEGWLTADLDHGTLPAALTLRARTTPLQPGEYTATVRLLAPGAAAESVTVTTRVVTGAAIGLDAAKICFVTELGGAAPRQNEYVSVTSVDGSVIDGLTATIVYDAGQPTGWLNAPLDATTAPARLRLLPSVGTLPVGTYTATVQVASPKAGNSPVPIRVTLTIKGGTSTLHLVIRREGNYVGKAKIHGPENMMCFEPDYPAAFHVCDKDFVSGSEVRLWAEGDYGEQFLRWEGPCGSDWPDLCVVQLAQPGSEITVTAVFGPKPTQRTLKLQVTGPGSVWSADVQCSSQNCAYGGHYYRLGDIVRLDPRPDLGAKLVRWTGCPAPSDTACFLTMTEDRVVGAEFAVDANVRTLEVRIRTDKDTGSVRVEGFASVSSADGHIGCFQGLPGTECVHSYELGTIVRLIATPINTARFIAWSGCPSPSGTSCDVPMTESRVVVAEFAVDLPPPTPSSQELVVEASSIGTRRDAGTDSAPPTTEG